MIEISDGFHCQPALSRAGHENKATPAGVGVFFFIPNEMHVAPKGKPYRSGWFFMRMGRLLKAEVPSKWDASARKEEKSLGFSSS